MSKTHEEVMRRFIEEVINNGNFSVLSDLLHPNYVYRSPDQELHGPEGIKDLFTAYRAAFPDLNIKIDDLVADGGGTGGTIGLEDIVEHIYAAEGEE